jgi:hypothetical protein
VGSSGLPATPRAGGPEDPNNDHGLGILAGTDLIMWTIFSFISVRYYKQSMYNYGEKITVYEEYLIEIDSFLGLREKGIVT